MKTNYAAVVVSALAYWILGAVWFAVLFGRRWMVLEGMTQQQAQSTSMAVPYTVSFALDLLMAFVLAHLCSWRNATTAVRGAAVGALLWIGIVGPIVYTTYMYERRSKELFAINEFYPLVGLCLMGVIIGAWKRKPA